MKINISSLEAMERFGERIAVQLAGGEIIELIGDVGAGKTTLTKAIARGLGITDPIQSPTFTISNRYDAPGDMTLIHYDFYRLNDAGIMKDELAEVLENDYAVTVIEWGDIAKDILHDHRLTIVIRPVGETARELEIAVHDQAMQTKLEAVL